MSTVIALTSGGLQAYLMALVVVLVIVWLALTLFLLRSRPGVCGTCGYSRAGLRSTRCPECGTEVSDDQLRAGFERVSRYIFRCSIVTLCLIFLAFGYAVVEPRLPRWAEVVYSGRFAPSTATFEARGAGVMARVVRAGSMVPAVTRLEIVSGADRVGLVRDPMPGGWLIEGTLDPAIGTAIESRMNRSISAHTLDQLLAHQWDMAWPFVAPEVVGAAQSAAQRDFALIDSKVLYNRSTPIANVAVAGVFTLAALSAVWWVYQRELRHPTAR